MEPIPIHTLATGLGLLSSSIFFSMNHTINYLTMPSLLLGSAPAPSSPASPKFYTPSTSNPQTPTNHLNRQWQEVYRRGSRVGIPSGIISGLAYSIAAYFESRNLNKALLIGAAAMSFVIPPYTIIWMVPTNDRLHARGDALSAGRDEELKDDEETTFGLLVKWVGCSKVRANLAVVAFGLAVAGLLVK